MERFNNYLSFSQNLPTATPTPAFLEFISGTTPLSTKLREKWLYELAKTRIGLALANITNLLMISISFVMSTLHITIRESNKKH